MVTTTYSADFAGLKVQFKNACKTILLKSGNAISEMIKENFLNEGFFGQHWEKVQRRQTRTIIVKTKNGEKEKTIPPAKGAAGKRRILTGDTGNLRRSIRYKVTDNTLIIYSDVVYAKIHNEGGMAGRGLNVKIPKRQFIGPHPQLDKKIKSIIENELKKIKL